MVEQNSTTAAELASVARALSVPFDAIEVKFKPQAVKRNRALALGPT